MVRLTPSLLTIKWCVPLISTELPCAEVSRKSSALQRTRLLVCHHELVGSHCESNACAAARRNAHALEASERLDGGRVADDLRAQRVTTGLDSDGRELRVLGCDAVLLLSRCRAALCGYCHRRCGIASALRRLRQLLRNGHDGDRSAAAAAAAAAAATAAAIIPVFDTLQDIFIGNDDEAEHVT